MSRALSGWVRTKESWQRHGAPAVFWQLSAKDTPFPLPTDPWPLTEGQTLSLSPASCHTPGSQLSSSPAPLTSSHARTRLCDFGKVLGLLLWVLCAQGEVLDPRCSTSQALEGTLRHSRRLSSLRFGRKQSAHTHTHTACTVCEFQVWSPSTQEAETRGLLRV